MPGQLYDTPLFSLLHILAVKWVFSVEAKRFQYFLRVLVERGKF